MKTLQMVAMVLFFGVTTVPAMAGRTIDPVPRQPDRSTVETGDPRRIICRREPILGSRLGVNRRCMTAAEWAQARQDDRQALERAQADRPTVGQ